MPSVQNRQSELATNRLYPDNQGAPIPTSSAPKIYQGARQRLPSSLRKSSLGTYFDWEDSWNYDYAKRPVILDLFSGAGGAAFGYYLAGFRVVGVDLAPQKHYPFEFHQADALEYLAEHGREFDFIHASPPCQRYSISYHMKNVANIHKKTPMLIEEVRRRMIEAKKPFVIENVPGAPLVNPIVLSGMNFGLKIIRKRLFELGGFDIFLLPTPNIPSNYRDAGFIPYHHGTSIKRGHLKNIWTKDRLKKAMGIDWMDIKELTQAIPPAYTEFIGRQIMKQIERPGVTRVPLGKIRSLTPDGLAKF
jgi:DNA (cytosine-5)-methyltransferase 1